jgi:DNA-binding NtrC family response regulator
MGDDIMRQVKYPELPILLIDDDNDFLNRIKLTLGTNGINHIITCNDLKKIEGVLQSNIYSIIALDMEINGSSGKELLAKIINGYPESPVIVISAINEIDTAVEILRMGVFDYIVKPPHDTRLVTSFRHILEFRDVMGENIKLKKYLLSDKLDHPEAFNGIVTQNNVMRSIFRYIEAIANTPLPILVTGETGTGKELIVKSIHALSNKKGEFVAANIAGFDDNLFSDTLFGHKKGAYTGADTDRKGLIEKAKEGTLFLDEIGDLSIESQVKLLRLIQEKQYYPLGSDIAQKTNTRIIVATNKDLESMVNEDKFRKDLYYRLKAHHIHLPPLRERKEDIPLLVQHFLIHAVQILRKKIPTVPRELYTLLKTYHFPGNIRELEGMIFDAISQYKSGILKLKTFYQKINSASLSKTELLDPSEQFQFNFNEFLPTLKEAEFILIAEALRRAEGNQTIAAKMLGITRRALNNRLQRLKK